MDGFWRQSVRAARSRGAISGIERLQAHTIRGILTSADSEHVRLPGMFFRRGFFMIIIAADGQIPVRGILH